MDAKLYSILSTSAALTALVPADRITPLRANVDPDLPCLYFYSRLEDSAAKLDTAPTQYRYGWAVDCLAETHDEADGIGQIVLELLNDYRDADVYVSHPQSDKIDNEHGSHVLLNFTAVSENLTI